jgi:hypothetical protein
MLTLSMEGMGKVSKSKATMATFWLALAKVEHGIPSWLVVAAMALARARALVKLMVASRSVPNMTLHQCSLVNWVSRAASSPMSSS